MKINQLSITKISSNLFEKKVLVIGDVMLDRYWFGEVNRISPEAPVPIAKVERTEDRPGGAANVARNIASLGGNVTLLTVVGPDEPAKTLQNLLIEEKVQVKFLHDQNISTTVKLRVIAKNQQLIRIDFEEKPSHEILAKVMDTYTDILPEYDVIILSDYGKGGLHHTTQMIELAKKLNKKILVDPKGRDFSKYRNATLITPNKNELREVVGNWENETELASKVFELKTNLNLKHLLLTRSEEGMTLYSNSNDTEYHPTHAKEVYDVSGAGDTVIATLGLMLANDVNISDAVTIANLAAGIVVGKLGTATVTQTELIDVVNNFIE